MQAIVRGVCLLLGVSRSTSILEFLSNCLQIYFIPRSKQKYQNEHSRSEELLIRRCTQGPRNFRKCLDRIPKYPSL